MNNTIVRKTRWQVPLVTFFLICIYGVSCKETQPTKPAEEKPPEVLIYDTTSHNITWKLDTIGRIGDELNDVYALNDTSFYAVGMINLSGIRTAPTRSIIRWNGNQWIDVPNVGFGESNEISGIGTAVVAFSESDIWIAGVRRTTRGNIPPPVYGFPFVHFDGFTWTTILAPQPSVSDPLARYHSIRDMWALNPTHLWAVGDSGLVYFWDGGTWIKHALPDEIYRKGISLNSITGFSATEIYCCGKNFDGESVLLKFNGNEWQVVQRGRLPHLANGEMHLFSRLHKGSWKMGQIKEDRLWLSGNKLYEWDRLRSPDSIRWGLNLNLMFIAGGSGGNNIFTAGEITSGFTRWNGARWQHFNGLSIQGFNRNVLFNQCATTHKQAVYVGNTSGFNQTAYLVIYFQ
jgi:hypothetical protein